VIAVAGYIIISSYLNAMREVVKIENIKIMNNEISTLKWISYVFLFISLCFIIYTFLNYTKKKSRDYAIFIILGQKKSNLFKCIIIELLATYIVSMILGSMIGASFYHGSIYLFKKVFLYEFPMVIYPIKSYIFIYMIYFALYFISALCIYIKIRKMKLNDLLIEEQRADTLAKKGWYRFVFGIGISGSEINTMDSIIHAGYCTHSFLSKSPLRRSLIKYLRRSPVFLSIYLPFPHPYHVNVVSSVTGLLGL